MDVGPAPTLIHTSFAFPQLYTVFLPQMSNYAVLLCCFWNVQCLHRFFDEENRFVCLFLCPTLKSPPGTSAPLATGVVRSHSSQYSPPVCQVMILKCPKNMIQGWFWRKLPPAGLAQMQIDTLNPVDFQKQPVQTLDYVLLLTKD